MSETSPQPENRRSPDPLLAVARRASELFMEQLWRERGARLHTPVEAQLVLFENELPTEVYVDLVRLTPDGKSFVELRRTQAENDGPVWRAIRAIGIDPLHIGSHLDYRVYPDGEGRVDQVLRHAAPYEQQRIVTR